ncbi:MAG: S1-like domain-containing RNA-binding protein [Prevotellaceae bacterium]|nr:S1-like domain-containing RNA-binding protein [Prevotellaceae bacterium]
MIELGKFNKLKVVKKVDFGLYLDAGKDEDKILLPTRYVPEGTRIGDVLDVFLYLDADERLIATTLEPLAQVGDFAYLKCSWVNEYGAFLDWGLMKDLFCPFREQKKRMEIGNSYIVHVHIDEDSFRIMASAKVEKFMSTEPAPYKHGDKVKLLVWQKTELGFKVIIDNKYPGLIYDNQIFRNLHTGDRIEAYIDQVREDGKIDVMLQTTGRQHTEEFSDQLLFYLQNNGGRCFLHDKSPAEDIYDRFHVSKKVFKKGVGDLYKKHLIEITPEGIFLVE